MKNLSCLLAVLLIIGLGSCGQKDPPPAEDPPVEVPRDTTEVPRDTLVMPPSDRLTYKWKLVGYVNVETGELIREESSEFSERNNILSIYVESDKECGHDILCISKNGYGEIKVILNSLLVNLFEKPFYRGGTEAYDAENGHLMLFYEAIETVESFEQEGDDLKLFYNNKKDYLLYKYIKP